MGANGTATYSTASLSAGAYDITATYSGDNNYPATTSTSVIVKIVPALGLGIENIGSSTSSVITFSFSSRTTLGSIAILTDGAPNLDFTDGGGGTCKVGTAYKSKSSCTVNVSFTPKASGARHGAVVLGDNNGHLLQTIYLEGTGVGPQLTFQPASETTIIPENSTPCAQAVDSHGDVYIVSSNGSTCGPITKWVPNTGNYTQSVVSSSTFSNQVSIAVDGAGNAYIADTGNGRVLKETSFSGVYSESVLATGLDIPRAVTVDGNGVVYFAVGIYDGSDITTFPHLYQETPSPAGAYVQTTRSLYPFADPTEMAIDDQGTIFVKDHELYCCTYFQDAIGEISASEYGAFVIGLHNQPIKLDFKDANGNLYATVDQSLLELMHGPGGVWAESCSPPLLYIPPLVPCTRTLAVPTNVWGMDGSGNFYGFVDNAITKVNSANPPSLRFAETNVGATSSDSPKTFTLQNVGNAPLMFSVPSAGMNPSVSSNFSLDPSTTCPQISTSGAALPLPINSGCSYAVNFIPTDSGTIDGSLIMSDNALNAVNGTQTIPLIGAGDAKTDIALLTRGPSGAMQVTWVSSGKMLSSAYESGEGPWVDTYSPTFVVGVAMFQTDQNGNATCTEIGAGSLSVASDVLGGIITPGQGRFALPDGVCPGHVYDWATATYTWGSNTSDLQDPFTLNWIISGGGTLSYNAEYTHINVTAATQNGPNGPITATASLNHPVPYANGYTWTITGGGGAITFPNGAESMGSTLPSITIQEQNPTGTSVPFSLTAKAGIKDSKPITYGPTQDTFCKTPATVDVWVNDTKTTTDDITVLNSTVTIPVQLTMHSDPGCGPETLTLSATPAGRISFNQTTFTLANGAIVNAVITPLGVSQTVDDVAITATVNGSQVGTAEMTVADVNIPAIRNTDTPTGMSDRIPPRVNTPIHITVTPNLGSSGQIIHLIPKNNNATNGDFTINGTTFQDLTSTTDVQLQGTTQTAPTAAPGGGNASKLNLDAQVRGQDAVVSSGFSVAAIPQNFTETLYGPAPGYPNTLGIQVIDSFESDSNNLSDLDQCQESEQVQLDNETGTLTGLGPGQNSTYIPCYQPGFMILDTHATPRFWLDDAAQLPPDEQAGHQQLSQTHIFLDLRTGVKDIPITNSGYYILRDITQNSQTNTLQFTTSKMGASTTANGYSSQAGAGQASLTQQ